MAIKKAAVLFGDDGANGKRVPIDVLKPTTDPAYGTQNRGIGFGESLTSMIANRPLYALALNDEDLETQIAGAITTLRTEYQNADSQVRADFATADNNVKAAIRSEFQAADTQVRSDFAAADTTVANNATNALNTQIGRLNQVFNYDLATNPKPAINTKVDGLETRIVTLEQNTTAGLGTRTTALEDMTANVLLVNTVKALRDKTGSSTLVTSLTNLEGKTGSSTLVTSLTNLEGKTGGSTLVTSLTNLEGVAGASALVTLIKNLRDNTGSTTLKTMLDGVVLQSGNLNTQVNASGGLVDQVNAKVARAGDTMSGPLAVNVAANVNGLTTTGGAIVAGTLAVGAVQASSYNFDPVREVTDHYIPLGRWTRNSNAGPVPTQTAWNRWAVTIDSGATPTPLGNPSVWGVQQGTVQAGESLHIPLRGNLPKGVFLSALRLGLYYYGSAPVDHFNKWLTAIVRTRTDTSPPEWSQFPQSNSQGQSNVAQGILPTLAANTLTYHDIYPYAPSGTPLLNNKIWLAGNDYELVIWNPSQFVATTGIQCIVSCRASYTMTAIL